jgi:hypothetical protein
MTADHAAVEGGDEPGAQDERARAGRLNRQGPGVDELALTY